MNSDNTKLTKEIFSNSRVIAKGRRIRDINRLTSQYGGQAKLWLKKSSSIIEEDDGELYEYHWYEHRGIGHFEIKKKKVTQQ